MKFKKILVNIASVVGLFFAFALPVGRMVFSETGEIIISRVMSWLGIYRDAEPGDSLIDTSLSLSFLLAISVVWLANILINKRNRKCLNVK
ncbi:conserved protein of unknown function [Burkholderia multivorans]